MLDHSLQNFFESLQMAFVVMRMKQEVIDVDQNILDTVHDSLHKALERTRTSQKSHWTCYPLELAFARQGKGCVWP